MNSLSLVARHYGRPVLMTVDAARFWGERATAIDPDAFQRPRSGLLSRPGAWLRKAGLFKDDQERGETTAPKPGFYAPPYAKAPDDEGLGWSLVEGIACIDVTGPLMDRGFEICGEWYHGYDTLALAMTEAVNDSRVGGVFLRLSSPGGVASGGLPDLAALMRELRASAGGKPIWAYCDEANSAAYWIAAQCDQIIAPAFGMLGSIGAVIVHAEESEALAMHGIKVTAIQFGEKKTDGASFKPLSAGAQADLQAIIDECGRAFVSDVALGRPILSAETCLSTQAGVFMAQHADATRSALAMKLCDQVMNEQTAFRALQAVAKGGEIIVPPNPGARAAADSKAGQIAAAKSPTEKTMTTKPKAEDAAAEGGGGADETVQKIADICAGGEIDADQKLILIRGILDEEKPAPAPAEPAPAESAPAAQSEADRAKAILALPEAKANPALANALAFTSKSVDDAKAAFKAAAGDRAAAKLEAIPDVSLGAAGEEAAAKSDDKKTAEFIVASTQAAGIGRRRR